MPRHVTYTRAVTMVPRQGVGSGVWLRAADVDIDELAAIVDAVTEPAHFPLAARIDEGVVVYDGDLVRAHSSSDAAHRELQAEMVHALADGPGIFVVTRAFDDTGVVDRVTSVFRALIDEQRAAGAVAGDHFAAPGANDRVWNALEKLALREPSAFVDYYANSVLATAFAAWLGPAYQVTSQVNVVNPGGAAQSPHCDYHLGFQSVEQAERYPAHVHRLSPALTLQAAVAHVDMPVESGPTMYLPHSQKYACGYLAWSDPALRELFERRFVQLPMGKGDAVFFNPALIHAAGHNRSTDVRRMANLLQVSSAFGRAMEAIDRAAMCRAIYPTLARATPRRCARGARRQRPRGSGRRVRVPDEPRP